MLIQAVPHSHPNDECSYKVPRRPFESARLDAELKVRDTPNLRAKPDATTQL